MGARTTANVNLRRDWDDAKEPGPDLAAAALSGLACRPLLESGVGLAVVFVAVREVEGHGVSDAIMGRLLMFLSAADMV